MSLLLDPPPTDLLTDTVMRRADESDITPLLRMLENLRRQTRRWIWVESLALIGLLSATVFWGLLLLDWSI